MCNHVTKMMIRVENIIYLCMMFADMDSCWCWCWCWCYWTSICHYGQATSSGFCFCCYAPTITYSWCCAVYSVCFVCSAFLLYIVRRFSFQRNIWIESDPIWYRSSNLTFHTVQHEEDSGTRMCTHTPYMVHSRWVVCPLHSLFFQAFISVGLCILCESKISIDSFILCL